MAERAHPAAFPLTADLAGVLAAARHERAEAVGWFFVRLVRGVMRIRRRGTHDPLDFAALVR